jgi:acetolactate synthase-1/2/3 large subunit
MTAMVHTCMELLPDDAILTNGAGNYSSWVHRFYQHRKYRTQLAPTSGAMGYGVPSGVAAAITHPERTVVSFSGDGCFLMNGQEMATAVQYGAKVIFIVVNNGIYGTIRMHQEREYPGRVSGTTLHNPDFAAHGTRIRAPRRADHAHRGIPPALERALAATDRHCSRSGSIRMRSPRARRFRRCARKRWPPARSSRSGRETSCR